MKLRILSMILLTTTLLALGCAAKRPVLYPNAALLRNGHEQSQLDISDCIESAKMYDADTDAAGRAAESTAKGAAVGAATSAAYGAVRGDAGARAAGGAAAGASAGLLHGIFRWRDPDPIESRFVGICLSDQGYQVIGWR